MSEIPRFKRYEDRINEAAEVVCEEIVEDLKQYFEPLMRNFGFLYKSGGAFDVGHLFVAFRNEERGDIVFIRYFSDDTLNTYHFPDEKYEGYDPEVMSQNFPFQMFVVMLSQWLEKIGFTRVEGKPE